MIDIKDVLDAFGMDGPNLVAGFIGGLISDFFDKETSPRERIGMLLAGTFFPAYGATPLADLIHMPHVLTALFMGYGGIQSLRMAYSKFFLNRINLKGDNNNVRSF